MDITPHVAAIREALEAVAGDDDVSVAVADRLSQALAPAVQLQLLDLLGQVALEVSSQLPDGRVDLQLAGREVLLVVTDTAADPSGAPTLGDDDTAAARLTLRMSDAMKSAVEAAAEATGQSTTAWLVAAARQALDSRPARRRSGGIGSRLSGYSQA
ncbi:MAG: DUF1778 domain-containing protein [Actinomycetota bacterium]|nr:DUF1778 domain-containing protein [Actinomycetota bacterium]